MTDKPKSVLREWREQSSLSLEAACQLFADHGFEKPSTAKLSRIEREQTIPTDMLRQIEALTGIPAKKLRPDLAKIFCGGAQ